MKLLNPLFHKVHDLVQKFSNLPNEYIKRSMEQVYWRTPRGKPNYLPRTIERKKFRYTTNRPWTTQFRMQNDVGTIRKKVFVEPKVEWSYFKNDRVEILVGKDKGKQGYVAQIIPERNWIIVSGLNWHYRKVGGDHESAPVMLRSESPLIVDSQVRLVDPSDLKATEFEWRFTEEGDKVRVSTRTGRIIPIPKANEETIDYKTKDAYIAKEKDTPGDVVSEITFTPTLNTFEADIMEQMNIIENGIPKKTYWY